jgi:hypothetical protein
VIDRDLPYERDGGGNVICNHFTYMSWLGYLTLTAAVSFLKVAFVDPAFLLVEHKHDMEHSDCVRAAQS